MFFFFFSQKHTLLFSFLREKLPKEYYKQLRAGFKEDLSGWLSTVATHLPTFCTTTWTDLAWYLEWCQIWSLWFMPQVLQVKRTVRSCQIHFRPLFCRTMVYRSSSVFRNISAFSSPFSNQFSWQELEKHEETSSDIGDKALGEYWPQTNVKESS